MANRLIFFFFRQYFESYLDSVLDNPHIHCFLAQFLLAPAECAHCAPAAACSMLRTWRYRMNTSRNGGRCERWQLNEGRPLNYRYSFLQCIHENVQGHKCFVKIVSIVTHHSTSWEHLRRRVREKREERCRSGTHGGRKRR